jgi:TonB family protein
MKILVAAVVVVAIAGISAPVLAGSNSARRTASVATPPELTASPDDGIVSFPARLRAPDLGRANQVAKAILSKKTRPGAKRRSGLNTRIRLCVFPSGAVTGVGLMKSSGAPAFDQAVLSSARAWVYESYLAPANVRICAAISVVYSTR